MDRVKVQTIDQRIILTLFLTFPFLSAISFPGKYTAISLLFTLTYCYYLRFKGLRLISVSYPLMLWLILTVYHWANGMQKKVPEVDILDLLHGIKIFACIAIFTFLARRDFEQTIKSLLICFQIYLIITSILIKISGGGQDRLSGEIIAATGLGQTAAISAIYIAYYSLIRKLDITKTALLYLLPLVVIILTQSRNSLAMLAIVTMGHAVAFSIQRGMNLRKVVLTLVILMAISFWPLNFLISNTALGNRLSNTESAAISAVNNKIATGTVFDKIVGDRLVYYVKGWRFFLESPWTGIGMWNYEYLSYGNYPLHTEYMIHLAEGGIIASILWILFVITVFGGVINSKYPKYIKILALFSLFEIMFCAIYARVFYYEFFYPVFGIALAISSHGLQITKKALRFR